MMEDEAVRIIQRLKNGCIFNKFDDPGVYAEYVRAIKKYNYRQMDKAVDLVLEEDSRNVPAISMLLKEYKKLQGSSTKAETIKNDQYCEVCDDKGYVLMTEEKDKLKYQYVLYCPFCAVGQSQAYNGKNCSKSEHKSNYYVPPITQYFNDMAIAELRRRNKERLRNKKQKAPGVTVDEIEEIKYSLNGIGISVPWTNRVEVISDADDSFYSNGEREVFYEQPRSSS